MNKEVFFMVIREKLSKFNKNEVDKIIDYYNELIEEKKENGLSEEDAIESFGDIRKIINTVTTDLIIENSNNDKSNTFRNFYIILGICASPILLPIGIALFAVVFSLFVVFVSVYFALIVSAFAVILAIIPLIIELQSQGLDISTVLLIIGAFLTSSGILILLTITTYKIGKFILNWVIKQFSKLIKNKSKKEINNNESF